ncbi:GNAT family N-acetyltransferase [Flammeovirga sp. SJP92]|uniref:GNAT family N-acetyltransferase n=1 Tax=Flammeovirga sp. SJP92 TaxID=1775430 RepID=UPI0007896263|nr:GNAT family N-acetyltransferase [Flammeovirga sp. SJP92]KXX67058.1 hypothetical protein AVL50_29235 [Flammeovirga sp. SJP92]
MIFEECTISDLEAIGALQPEGWPDIIPKFEEYIDQEFSFPIKVSIDNEIVGIGCAIVFKKTGWLAHIIVDSEQRNKGIGLAIVNYLLELHKANGVESSLLIATDLGAHVYKKVGFKTVSNYLFLKRESGIMKVNLESKKLIPYQEEHYPEILKLDYKITGEHRRPLLMKSLKDAVIFKEKDLIQGAFLPNLGEGLIIATTPEAGIELMKLKYSTVDKAVIPEENKIGLEFLLKNSFQLSPSKGQRMLLGNEVAWKADGYFGRIGGNFG